MKVKFTFFLLLLCQIANAQSGIYSFSALYSPNERKLINVDPSSAIATTVSPFSIFEWYIPDGGMSIDGQNKKAYAKCTFGPKSDPNFILGIDLLTGLVTSKVPVNTDDAHMLRFNPQDGFLYGIQVIWSPNERRLVKINPADGTVTVLSSSSIFSWYQENGGVAFDPINQIYYIRVTIGSNANHFIVGIDVKTGEILSQVPVIAEDFNSLEFNIKDGYLYAIKKHNISPRNYLIKIDPVTGLQTTLSNSSVFYNYLGLGGTSFDFINGIYYAIGYGNDFVTKLIGIDIINGDVVFSEPIQNDNDFHQMEFVNECTDASFTYSNPCFGGLTSFVSTTCADSIHWDFGDPLSAADNMSMSADPYHTFTSFGDFQVTLYSYCGNLVDSTSRIVHIFENYGSVFLGNDTLLCGTDSLVIDLSNKQGDFIWNGVLDSARYQVTSSGEYTLQLNRKCETLFDTIEVVFSPLPKVELGKDTMICSGSSITIPAVYNTKQVVWNNGLSDSILTVSSAGKYSASGTNICGISVDSIEVSTVDPPTIFIGNDTILCEQDSFNLILDKKELTFQWDDGSMDPIRTIDFADIYWAETINICGKYRDSIQVDFSHLPAIELGSDTLICSNFVLDIGLDSSLISSVWNDGSVDTKLKIDTSGLYWVSGTNLCGTIRDSIAVTIGVIPTLDLQKDTVVCDQDNLLLVPQMIGNSFQWKGGHKELVRFVENSGTYVLTVNSECGTVTDSVQVEFIKKPSVRIVMEPGESSPLSLRLDSVWYDVLWSQGSTEKEIFVNGGNYWAEGKNECGIDSDSIFVKVDDWQVNKCVVYPNPIQAIGTAVCPSSFEPKTLWVYDSGGKLCLKFNFSSNTLSLDDLHLARGFYYFKIVGHDKAEVLKVIVH